MNWDDLQCLTADCLRLYEALRRAERLEAEGERLLGEAEALLRRAALAYVLEPLPPEHRPASDAESTVGTLAESWADVQQARSELLMAARRLAQAQMASGKWEEAVALSSALCALRQEDAEFAALLKQAQTGLERVRVLQSARQALDASRYDEACVELEAWLKSHPDDAEARDLCCETCYRSALAAMEARAWDRAAELLQALRQLNPAYRDRDIADWMMRLGWYRGPIRAVQKFDEHVGWVSSVAFSPDGRLLASGSGDWTVKLWAPRSGS